MPIKKSAKKAVKQAIKKRAVNVEFKDLMKSAVKAVKKAVEAKADNIAELVVFAQKRIDKASKRNIISKESAGRKKSNLMKTISKEGISLSTVTKAPKITKEKVTKAPKVTKEKVAKAPKVTKEKVAK